MKNIIGKIIILFLLLISFAAITFAQEINLTFKSTYACAYESLDSVKIENLTQGGDTVLYYPDTVLTINLAGIEEHLLSKQGFYVTQNYPNPFINETKFELNIIDAGEYNIRIFDLSGREVDHFISNLKRGVHEFTFCPGYSGSFVTSVNSEKAIQKVLMICAESSNKAGSGVYYSSLNANDELITKNTKSNFTFEIDDELRYTAYINNENTILRDYPQCDSLYTFNIASGVPLSPELFTSEIGDGTVFWTWDDVPTANGYKYNTTNDYNTAIDIGLVNELTQNFPTDVECGLKLNIFLWSYNTCGHSSFVEFEDFKEHQISDYVNNEKYYTVLIGDQCWLQENLRAYLYANGDEITYLPYDSWLEVDYGVWSYPENNPENDDLYGKHYGWYAVLDERNICPEGWHVPSDDEWAVLRDFLGGSSIAGEKMKIEGTDFWEPPNVATNESFFSALPSGSRFVFGGETIYFGTQSVFWSTTGDDSETWLYALLNTIPVFNHFGGTQHNGQSVRCVRD